MMLAMYSCILFISWLSAHMIIASGNNPAVGLTTGNLITHSCILYEYSYEPHDAFNGIRYGYSMASAERIAEVINEKADITNPEKPEYEVANGSIRFENVDFRYSRQA